MVCAFTAPNWVVAVLDWTVLACFSMILERGSRSTVSSLTLSLPFAPLLIVVHALLNPAFAVDKTIFGLVPFRSLGLDYAALVTCRLGLIMLGLVVWRLIDRSEFARATLVARWVPKTVALTVLQVVALFYLFTGRIATIVAAQRSRGVPIDSGFLSKVRYLPAVVVPLVAAVLTETDQRHCALQNRGLGIGLLTFDYHTPNVRPTEVVAATFVTLLLILLRIVEI